jgi:hypothetical protein
LAQTSAGLRTLKQVCTPGVRETPVEPAKSKPVMIERAKFIFKFERSKQGRPAFLSNRRFSYAWYLVCTVLSKYRPSPNQLLRTLAPYQRVTRYLPTILALRSSTELLLHTYNTRILTKKNSEQQQQP